MPPDGIVGVVFDYGSTLIWFDDDLDAVRPMAHRALADALREEKIPVPDCSFLKRFERNLKAYNQKRGKDNLETTTGSVLADTLKQFKLGAVSRAKIERVLRPMYRVYEEHWRPFPETHEALRQIRGMGLRMALLSNASDEANVLQMLQDHRLEDFFETVIVSAGVGIRKPDPRPFHMILKTWQVHANHVVMVGDQLWADVFGAQGVGMRTIWLRTEKDTLANEVHRGKILPDAEADHIGQVPAILREWSGLS